VPTPTAGRRYGGTRRYLGVMVSKVPPLASLPVAVVVGTMAVGLLAIKVPAPVAVVVARVVAGESSNWFVVSITIVRSMDRIATPLPPVAPNSSSRKNK
jgi:hypothetical protein